MKRPDKNTCLPATVWERREMESNNKAASFIRDISSRKLNHLLFAAERVGRGLISDHNTTPTKNKRTLKGRRWKLLKVSLCVSFLLLLKKGINNVSWMFYKRINEKIKIIVLAAKWFVFHIMWLLLILILLRTSWNLIKSFTKDDWLSLRRS